ncbi:DUF2207 domain-containing protein [Raineyella fluvialis]|uniref:DUF2207 domain-containing protein n=1 Tax=Raineyella fluvialis TaxID=2662261 RepID=A0A5Q2FF50_9ACTN|nr:DUF2207 domain-containing protein [Raineyella fluvialis]QGF23335.1 DUF2207 domain-containing protein [Raineyella fluvialis]
MTPAALLMVVVGLVVTAVTILAIVRSRRSGLDEIYEGVTPGQLPARGQQALTRRVADTEYTRTVAVQFTPPKGLRPGLVGTIYDGVAESRDVTATIVDLAVRGYVRIRAVEPEGEPVGRAEKARPDKARRDKARPDWEVVALDPPADDELSVMEAHLLNGLFAYGPSVRISQLTGDFGQVMREAVQALYTEVVHRGWYRRHPRAKNGLSGAGLWGLAIGGAVVMVVVGVGPASSVLCSRCCRREPGHAGAAYAPDGPRRARPSGSRRWPSRSTCAPPRRTRSVSRRPATSSPATCRTPSSSAWPTTGPRCSARSPRRHSSPATTSWTSASTGSTW